MHIHGVVGAIQFGKTGKSYIEGYIGIIYSDWAQNQSMATNHKNKDEWPQTIKQLPKIIT
jgi:hypothetical protein